jgi:arabinose-5-phosphate isomerase
MIKDLLKSQKESLDYFFCNIDEKKIEEVARVLEKRSGSIIFSGVGKSGIIANKLAMTFLSTGTKSVFLPVLDAFHGDIGIISKDDVLILLSKTGETTELINMVPYAKRKGAFIISIVSDENSHLAKKSDMFIFLPLKQELCPYNLVPTTSTTLQLIIGDILAVMLMKKKNFSLAEYAKNHPAGLIGKKISLYVEDLMIKGKDIPFCRQTDKVIDILSDLSSKKCGSLIVVDDEKKLKGIFTDGDLRRAIEVFGSNFLYKTIEQIMTKTPKFIRSNVLAFEAMKLMEEDEKKLITVLPVIDNEKVIGILRMHDILQAGLS